MGIQVPLVGSARGNVCLAWLAVGSKSVINNVISNSNKPTWRKSLFNSIPLCKFPAVIFICFFTFVPRTKAGKPGREATT